MTTAKTLDNLLSFPAPSPELVAAFNSGDRRASLKAQLQYRREGEVIIEVDGRPLHISPNSAGCKTALTFGAPVAVEQADVDHAIAERLKWERFHAFCQEDGHDGVMEANGYCDHCGKSDVKGAMHYQPNAMGYPTPVMFQCDTCSSLMS